MRGRKKKRSNEDDELLEKSEVEDWRELDDLQRYRDYQQDKRESYYD